MPGSMRDIKLRRMDLHTHSHYSDGTLAPGELVRRAAMRKIEIFFLTDHDNVAGFPEARKAGQKSGLAVHCGVEINTSAIDQIHILGYGIDWQNPDFLSQLEEFRARRRLRAQRIVERLQAHGIAITLEDVAAAAHGNDPAAPLGRPHVADALRSKGLVRNREDAFKRFLTRGKPGYVEPMGPSPEEAIALIRNAGGFSSLAHPETVSSVTEKLAHLKAKGLEGLEVYYGANGPAPRGRWENMAKTHGLLPTGGSDFHGPETGRDRLLGVEVPSGVLESFLERLKNCATYCA